MTSVLNTNTTAAEMKAALEALEGIGSVNVQRDDLNGPGFEWA